MKGKKEKVTIVEGGDLVNMRKNGMYKVARGMNWICIFDSLYRVCHEKVMVIDVQVWVKTQTLETACTQYSPYFLRCVAPWNPCFRLPTSARTVRGCLLRPRRAPS
jgi:hypothetical protein